LDCEIEHAGGGGGSASCELAPNTALRLEHRFGSALAGAVMCTFKVAGESLTS